MNTYCLISPDGKSYGPVDEDGLIHWARERRLAPASQVRCAETGIVAPAASLTFLANIFNAPPLPVSPPVAAGASLMTTHQLSHMPVVAVIILNYLTIGIFPLIWFALMHGKMPKVRPDDPSGGKAVGFMFIPFFNLYWIFFSYLRLCQRVDEQRTRYGLRPSNLQGLAIAMCIVKVIPYVDILGWLFLDPIFFGLMQSSVNELVALTAATFVKKNPGLGAGLAPLPRLL